MSQVSPGWYPDPSGRFAQRYHDGARWTEHVADGQGNRATDVPAGQAGPASYAGSAEAHGRGGRPGHGGRSTREQGYGQDWRTAGQRPGGARYEAGQGRGAPPDDAGRPYGQQTAYGQPGYAYAPSGSSAGFTPTIGLIVAAVGAVLLLLSLFGLDFLELSFPGLSRSISLGDIAGDFGEGAPAALSTYADFGRFLAVLVIGLAILAVAQVVPQLRDISALPVIVAVACGAFALWHVLAMLASGEEGVDVSPTMGAILGLLGYVGLAAAPFLRQPIQAQR
ncbi:MAG: DUF2510 domain-containing protein [Acidimicrobiales bacterium]